jgi:hypothetical protein
MAGVLLLVWGSAVQAGVKIQSEVSTTAAPAVKLIVYADGAPSTPFAPSGWMGNQSAIKLDEKCTQKPHTGETCIKLQYSAPDKWGGIIWQDPPSDWGDKPGGHDLTGAAKLTFWARGEAGGERVKFVFGVIKPEKPHSDSASGEMEAVLTKEWTQYSIDLTGKNLSRIKTGFGWTVGGQGKPITFYLDDIKYE